MAERPFIGFVCGLTMERRLLDFANGDGRIAVAASGAVTRRAQLDAERFADEGAAALVSFGLTGGLVPHARTGDLIFPQSIVFDGGESWSADVKWHAAALSAAREGGFHINEAPIAGSNEIVTTAEDKAALGARTGADAVDMESHAVARVAAVRGIPFLALRVIGDDHRAVFPPAAVPGIAPNGDTRPGAVMAALVRRPQDLPAVIALARASRTALGSLGRALPVVWPALLRVMERH